MGPPPTTAPWPQLHQGREGCGNCVKVFLAVSPTYPHSASGPTARHGLMGDRICQDGGNWDSVQTALELVSVKAYGGTPRAWASKPCHPSWQLIPLSPGWQPNWFLSLWLDRLTPFPCLPSVGQAMGMSCEQWNVVVMWSWHGRRDS